MAKTQKERKNLQFETSRKAAEIEFQVSKYDESDDNNDNDMSCIAIATPKS